MDFQILPLRCRIPVGKEVLEKYPGIQVLDARYIAGEDHLRFAVSQAEKAAERGRNLSPNPLYEVLLRASAQRQIRKAIEAFGVEGSREIIALGEEIPRGFLEEYGCRSAPEIFEVDEEKFEALKEFFSLSEEEIEAMAGGEVGERRVALREAIKERIALLEL
jgi:KEOPS complex subunit Cgi121